MSAINENNDQNLSSYKRSICENAYFIIESCILGKQC